MTEPSYLQQILKGVGGKERAGRGGGGVIIHYQQTSHPSEHNASFVRSLDVACHIKHICSVDLRGWILKTHCLPNHINNILWSGCVGGGGGVACGGGGGVAVLWMIYNPQGSIQQRTPPNVSRISTPYYHIIKILSLGEWTKTVHS